MVTITINGKKAEREFQNMAQALAWAYQSGECYNAEKIEFAYAAAKEAAGKAEQKPAGEITGPAGEAAKPAPAGSGKKPDAGKQEGGSHEPEGDAA